MLAEPEVAGAKFKTFRFCKLASLCAVYFSLAVNYQMSGPTFPAMQVRLGACERATSTAIATGAVGGLAGAALGGVICDVLPVAREPLLAVGALLLALCSAAIPWTGDVWAFGALHVGMGFFKGMIDSSGNTLVLGLLASAGVASQLIHFSFGVGSLVVPQIVRPFLGNSSAVVEKCSSPASAFPSGLRAPSVPSQIGFAVAGEITNRQSLRENWPSSELRINDPSDATIEIAFAIGASVSLVSALAIGAMIIWARRIHFPVPDSRKSFGRCFGPSPESEPDSNSTFNLVLLAGFALFYFQNLGAELSFGLFIFSYATRKDNPLESGPATLLNSTYWFAFTVFRAVGAILARFLRPIHIMLAHSIALWIAGVLFAALGDSNEALWPLTIVWGIAVSNFFPGGLAWANDTINFRSTEIAVVLTATSLGAFSYQTAVGAAFERYGPSAFRWFMPLIAALQAAVVVPLALAATSRRRQFAPKGGVQPCQEKEPQSLTKY